MAEFLTVTETPGQWATAEQLAMMSTRYGLAEKYSRDKEVLEIACGSGFGLGWLASQARSVIGGDIDHRNLEIAKKTYQGRDNIRISLMNALDLPLANESLDTIVIFEAIYYLEDVGKFLSEAKRVLRPGGALLISTVNREWHGFNPSPFSQRYLSAREISELLSTSGFESEIFKAFHDMPKSFKKRVVAGARKAAVWLDLIPKSMDGKKYLKRIFYGKLSPIQPELMPETDRAEALLEVKSNSQITNYKVLYAIGKKPEL